MTFGTLALIGLCGFVGPLLATGGHGAVPVVVGELLAGVVIGRTGLDAIDTSNATLSFLSDIGFAMLMFAVGMSVPLRDSGLRESLRRGATSAAIAAGIAVLAGLLAARIGGGRAIRRCMRS
jgi:Kef-type K+ transport system membrane component KefB